MVLFAVMKAIGAKEIRQSRFPHYFRICNLLVQSKADRFQ
jgi:hypothetical protein